MFEALAFGGQFTARDLGLILHCMAYADDPVGLPSHNLMLIIAKLVKAISGGMKPQALNTAVRACRDYTTEVERLSKKLSSP